MATPASENLYIALILNQPKPTSIVSAFMPQDYCFDVRIVDKIISSYVDVGNDSPIFLILLGKKKKDPIRA